MELAEKTQILRMIVGFLKIGQTEAPVRFIKLEALWILLNLSYGLNEDHLIRINYSQILQ